MQDKLGVASFEKVCRRIHLPAPRACDIAPIKSGYVLPIEDYGCLLRIEILANDEKIRYPLGIMPIVNFRLFESEDFCISAGLYPANPNIGIAQEDYEKLKAAALEQFNLYLSADAEDDCAYVSRVPAEGFPNGVPMVIDVTDAVQLRKYVEHKKPENWQSLAPFFKAQDERYRAMREDADNVVCAATPEDFTRLTHAFWSRMKRMTQTVDAAGTPILSACWKNAKPGNTKLQNKLADFSGPSAEYALRLRADPFHEQILAAA